MREILFRGKRIDNSEWVEGSLLADYEQNEFYIAEYFDLWRRIKLYIFSH